MRVQIDDMVFEWDMEDGSIQYAAGHMPDEYESFVIKLAHFVAVYAKQFPGDTTPSVVTDLGLAFGYATDVAGGLDDWSEMLPDAVAKAIDDEAFAQLLMAKLSTTEVESWQDFPKEQRLMGLSWADHMGPDWAQALYHMAVFVSRNA